MEKLKNTTFGENK